MHMKFAARYDLMVALVHLLPEQASSSLEEDRLQGVSILLQPFSLTCGFWSWLPCDRPSTGHSSATKPKGSSILHVTLSCFLSSSYDCFTLSPLLPDLCFFNLPAQNWSLDLLVSNFQVGPPLPFQSFTKQITYTFLDLLYIMFLLFMTNYLSYQTLSFLGKRITFCSELNP